MEQETNEDQETREVQATRGEQETREVQATRGYIQKLRRAQETRRI